ncbi:MAG: hypothetical protein ACYSOV_00145, partial [Planctomycetota bacterium]
LLDWLPELERIGIVKDEYVREILDIAEQKAAGQKEGKLLKRVREQTVSWLAERKAWEQAAVYLSGINYSPSEKIYSDRTDFEAFNIYLYSGEFEKAAEYVNIRLKVSDISKDSALAASINGYFSEKGIEDTSKKLFLGKLSSIPKNERPNWSSFLGELGRQLNPSAVEEPAVSEGGTGE